MRTNAMTAAGCLVLLLHGPLAAQELAIDREPVLRIEAGGPTAFVTALAFSPDSQGLYAAGYDKVVHSWTLDAKQAFTPTKDAYRVPIGPGIDGAIAGVAFSPDGAYLAVAGRGVARGVAGFRQPGLWVPSLRFLSDAMWEDQGTITLFHTRTGEVRQLRGHRGPVMALAFAPARAGQPATLASVGREWQGKGYAGAVRLWDATNGKELRRLGKLPDPAGRDGTLWPRLNLWREGELIRVALAWEDGTFRVWDVAEKTDRLLTDTDGAANNTVAALPERNQVVTGSFADGKGQLRLWNVAGKDGLEVVRQIALPAGQKPRALALLPAGKPDKMAIVVETPGDKTTDTSLRLFTLADFKPLGEALPLWSGRPIVPVLAVSPDGQSLAVAGNADHRILAVRVADLVAGRKETQILRGAGAPVRSVAFVRKGDSLGLLLGDTARAAPGTAPLAPHDGDLVFDFARRGLGGDTTGWKLDQPAAEGWQVQTHSPRDEKGQMLGDELRAVQDGKRVGTVKLRPNQFVTDFALLPPRPPLDTPLLAVALLELGQPMLRLYDARTGSHLRQLTGHVNRVDALAFRGDGRFLVSTARDQTTCVWALADLPRLLGKKGQLHGLAFAPPEKGGGLTLAEIDAGALLPENKTKLDAAGVKEGDAVEGIVVAGKLRPTPAVRDLTDGIVLVKPGTAVTLRFTGRGDVALVVGPAVGDDKPLLTLFVTRPEKGAPRQWIGWSPVGPYDFSDRAAEQLLGWHRNTGDPRKPVVYALANEYRDTYHKPDILRYLMATGNTGQALESWQKDHPVKVREPKMALYLKEIGPAPVLDERGRARLDQPRATLLLSIQELPAGKVEGVRWQVGDERGECQVGADGEWSADLTRQVAQRGDHRIRATLTMAGDDARAFARDVFVRYQPARPALKLIGRPGRSVDKPELRLQAEVLPGAGQTVRVVWQHRHEGKDLPADKPQEIKDKMTVETALRLQPGLNQIRLSARNLGAAADDAAESDTIALDILYKAVRPQITLTSIIPLPDGAALPIDAAHLDKPMLVDVPKVRVVGEIEALEKIASASWITGEIAKEEKRSPLTIDKGTRVAFDQEVTLSRPGQTLKVRFYARSEGSDDAERTLLLQYQPRLPELRLTSPVEGQVLTRGRDEARVTVQGRLVWPEGRHACVAQLIVNDQEQGKPIPIAADAETFKATADLRAGDNTVQVRLSNDWRRTATAKVALAYRRPPVVASLQGPARATKPFADVTALVETPTALPLTRLKVNGTVVSADEFKPAAVKEAGDTTTYRVLLRELPLTQGANRIEVQAANADGWSLKAETLALQFEMPAPPRAEVVLLNPRQDGVVEEGQVSVEFQVRSLSPLKKLEVERNDTKAYQKTNLDRVVKGTDGYYEVKESRPVTLQPGPNRLKVVVQNAGGEASSTVVVLTYQVEPVAVRIDRLDDGDTPLSPLSVVGDGKLLFPAAARDQVTLHGEVRWQPANDSQLSGVQQVRVYVNGSQQLPAPLDKAEAGQRVRRFKTVVRLTREMGNQIAVRLIDVGQEAGSRNRCLVDCKAGAAARRQAHVLVVDTGKDDEKAVTARVLQAMGGNIGTGPRFTLPGFADGGRLYGPLVGAEVAPDRIYIQLLTLKRNLQLRAAAGASDDAVFLYFRSGEAIDAEGHFFRTGDVERDPELRYSGIPCDYLRRFCAENLGAQVVLLDVVRDAPTAGAASAVEGQDRVAQWAETPNVAVVRYSWRGPAAQQGAAARLLADWEAATATPGNLGDMVKRLSAKFEVDGSPSVRLSRQFKSQLTLSQSLPGTLHDLPLGQP